MGTSAEKDVSTIGMGDNGMRETMGMGDNGMRENLHIPVTHGHVISVSSENARNAIYNAIPLPI